ncbi:acyl-CoA dehydrogenase family protein [Achromobacter spanius]|uniref:acyl-CoA dehydrogenase family protein n=1 Tax=Achromobacter spanius TaxID=217203 RepID=UPI00380A3763
MLTNSSPSLVGKSGFFAQLDAMLDPAERDVIARAREYCDARIAPESFRAFRAGEPYARSVIEEWASRGFLALQVPPSVGGSGASFLCKVRLAQEVALHSFATAFSLNNLQGSVTRVARNGSPKQQEAYLEPLMCGELLGAPALTEPQSGSDLGALTMVARKAGKSWVLSGTKSWVTNGQIANLPLVMARVEDREAHSGDVASFLVHLEALAPTYIRREIATEGGRSFRVAQLELSEHVVPDWAVLVSTGDAFKASMATINAARVHVGAMCTATLYSALAEAVAYCSERKAFGEPLLNHQGLRWELAEVATRLEAANALVVLAARHINDGNAAVTLSAQAKKFAVDTAIWGVDQCLRCVGAIGTTPKMRLAMHQAELRFAAYTDGTGQLLLDRVGKNLAKEYYGTTQR